MLAAMEVNTTALRTLVRPHAAIAGVDANEDAERVQEVSRDSGHLRLVVWRATAPIRVVHVRDTLDADPVPLFDLMRPC